MIIMVLDSFCLIKRVIFITKNQKNDFKISISRKKVFLVNYSQKNIPVNGILILNKN